MLADNSWFPDWRGMPCVVVASGQSASKDEVEKVRGCRVVTINTSYQLAPWADALYACDEKWWRHNHEKASEFYGLKISQDDAAVKAFGLKKIRLADPKDDDANNFTFKELGRVGRGGFSGFQAVNLVAQFGANPIGVIGFDFHGEHWHGKHPQGMINPRPQTLEKWAEVFDEQKPILDGRGISLFNLSPDSRSVKYQKASVDEFISIISRLAA